LDVCEFRKVQIVQANARNAEGGIRFKCNCNGLQCLVDEGVPSNCLRFAWVKKVQNKTAKLVAIQEELNQLALEGMPNHG
jgi:hypothetical protein